MQSATVYLESVQDSTLITYSITDKDGLYNLQGNTASNKVRFTISYQGYKDYSQLLDITTNREIKMPLILLSDDIEQLADVLVVAKKAPITVKQDTLEFNAKSFNTQPDATLEDIMKKLPGVEVDKDGKVTVNGKEVSRILVNGKEFFGDDPKIALKNLPKEIIDKIRVTDSKTDDEKAAGEIGDANVSEINITIDEDKNKGFFSRLTAGGGTEERYSMSGIANYFNYDFKISVLGSSNNINSPGFSFDEVYDAMGGGAFSFTSFGGGGFGIDGINFGGGGGGITSSRSLGTNITNDWGDEVSAHANYFYGGNETRSATDTRRTTFLPDRSFNTISSDNSNRTGDSHRASGRVTVKPDTLTTIRVNLNSNFSNNQGSSNSNSTSTAADGQFINSITTTDENVSDSQDLGARLSYTRRGKRKGDYYGISGNVDYDDNDSQRLFNSTTTLADGSVDLHDQNIDEHTDNTRLVFNPRGRKMLSDDWSVSASYRLQSRVQNNDRSVFDRSGAGATQTFNAQLSADFKVTNLLQQPRAGVRYRKDKWTVELEGGLLYQTLDNRDDLRGTSFDKEFSNPFIDFSVRRKIGKSGRIYVNYNNDINVPSANQLQPFEDRTNPQNIRTGNPDLDAGQNHNFSFRVNNYNWEDGSGFYGGGRFRLRDRAVASFSTVDDNLIRRSTFVNIDGQYNGSVYSSYRKKWKKDAREISARVGMNASYALNKAFNNGVQYESRRLGLNPNLELGYSYDDIIDVGLEYRLSNTSTTFENISTQEQDFTNHTVSMDLTTFWPENVVFGIRGEYQKFGNVTDEFDDDSIVLIGSLGYKFSKDRANIKLKAYDLLNEIINNRRSVSDDFVADTRSLVLTQYFMLSFTYKFSKFGGKKPAESGIFIN